MICIPADDLSADDIYTCRWYICRLSISMFSICRLSICRWSIYRLAICSTCERVRELVGRCYDVLFLFCVYRPSGFLPLCTIYPKSWISQLSFFQKWPCWGRYGVDMDVFFCNSGERRWTRRAERVRVSFVFAKEGGGRGVDDYHYKYTCAKICGPFAD